MLGVIVATSLSWASPCTPSSLRTLRPRMALAQPAALPRSAYENAEPMLSGLQGRALLVEAEDVPSKNQVRAVVPDHCFKRSTLRSLAHLVQSLMCTAACAAGGLLLPLKAWALPLWVGYAAVTGTTAMGLWVLAHECGHGAFSDNRRLQDSIGCDARHRPRLVSCH